MTDDTFVMYLICRPT